MTDDIKIYMYYNTKYSICRQGCIDDYTVMYKYSQKMHHSGTPGTHNYCTHISSVFVLVHKLSVAVEGTPYHGFSPGRIEMPLVY